MIKYSIILPVYNSEKYLNKTIPSILNQTYNDFELIIVNDGSTDQSLKIIKSYSELNYKIVLINKKNEGVSKARNDALEIAKGDYVIFVDSDDFIDENLLDFYNKNLYDELMICTGYKQYILDNKNEMAFCTENKGFNLNLDNKQDILNDIWLFISRICFNQLWNKVYSNKIIKDNNIRFNSDLDIGEDFLFNLKYFEKINKLTFFDKAFYNYNITQCSLTKKFRENRIDIHILLAEEYRNVLKNNNCKTIDADNFLIKSIYGAFTDLYNKNCTINKSEYIKNVIYKDYVQNIIKSDIKFNDKLYSILFLLLKYKLILLIKILSKYYNKRKYKRG